MSTSAPLKSGSHLPTLKDWRWDLWQVSGEDFSCKYKHQILLSGPFNNQYTGELQHSTPLLTRGKPTMPAKNHPLFKICKFLMFRSATILDKSPPATYIHKAKKNLCYDSVFYASDALRGFSWKTKTGTLSCPSGHLNATLTCG